MVDGLEGAVSVVLDDSAFGLVEPLGRELDRMSRRGPLTLGFLLAVAIACSDASGPTLSPEIPADVTPSDAPTLADFADYS
jgi:hypothetical protein